VVDRNAYDIGDSITLVGVFATRPTLGSIDAGSNQLTVHDATGYVTGDTVVVRGAGVGGEDLVAAVNTIAGNTFTLAKQAASTVVAAQVGKATNPTTVTCKVRKPDGTVATPAASNVSVGRYEATFDPDAAGVHRYRFEGTGAAKAAGERDFRVLEKRVG
jgi:hypothetical protein